MQLRILVGSSLLATGVVAGSACYGAVQDEDKTDPVVIGERAQLVQKKRTWLLNYDEHCTTCFEAFELCEKGSLDVPDATNCKAALDACVRGGLITDADAGASAADAGAGADSDASVVPVLDADAGLAGDVDVDAAAAPGVEPAADAGQALDPVDASTTACIPIPVGPTAFGDLSHHRRDAAADLGANCLPQRDASVERDAEIAVDLVDAGAVADAGDTLPGRPIFGDASVSPVGSASGAAPSALEQAVVSCLSEAQVCLDASATVQDCVDALRDCVRLALEQSFDTVCTTQLAACHAEHAPAQATGSVESLCQQDLGFAEPAGK